MFRTLPITAALLVAGTAHAVPADWQCNGSQRMDMRQVQQLGPEYRISGTITRSAPDISKARGNNAVVYIRLASASMRDKVEAQIRGADPRHASADVFQNYEQVDLDLGAVPVGAPLPFELKVRSGGGSLTVGSATRRFALTLSGPVTAMLACNGGDYDFVGIDMGAGPVSGRPDGFVPRRPGAAAPPAGPMPDWAKGRRRPSGQ
ncbi:hypothetical protein P6144_14615 [Sphingomonas sp. HITSZ_GF]|uniref:hypothetical protein n=1 Tax=Sphingomonas sp. HITSZ_GF TaxID=3037247 RepID=UPI00240D5895|nr:hypothetical protein [Sphingomonas sp. HITSZ_GF]MDG2534890.1 hypothetical protein [Sphingomonas sp. HITSZ_GF]